MMPIDWSNRWLGGMCPAGALDGLPIRALTFPSHPSLEDQLLPPGAVAPATTNVGTVQSLWSAALGERPVLLVNNLSLARRLVLGALGVSIGGAVGLPATATRPLVEDVKRCGARPVFCGLDDALALERPDANVAVIWSQSLAGLPAGIAPVTGDDPSRVCHVLENPDTVPGPIRAQVDIELHALHLSADPETSGAILVVHDSELACRLRSALSEAADQPDLAAIQAQLWRLADLARRQSERVAELRRGLTDAAGLALLADSASTLPGGVAVQIPPEADPATFFAYVKAENTPVAWLPETRPLHYAAVRQGAGLLETGRRLARWLMIPVGPDDSPEEIGHAVLGVVKAADYLGVRWRLDPERAGAYARLMDEWYGLDHDAYRPVFVTPKPVASRFTRDPEAP